MIAGLLESELSNSQINSDLVKSEEIMNLKRKFGSLQNLNIPITDNVFLFKRKDPVLFILSNGALFISNVYILFFFLMIEFYRVS